MSSLADLFPPGTDICKLPSGAAPPGGVTDFSDTGLRSLTISASVISTTLATIIGLGRLYANIIKPTLSDIFVSLAILLNIGAAVVMIVYAKYFRHQWNFPLYWLNGTFEKVSYIWQMTFVFSVFFGNTATFMLFRSLFGIKRSMRTLIWVGIGACFLLYGSSLGALSYFAAPKPGETWDELMVKVIGTTIFPLYWGVAQGAAGTMLDIYIFILPLPVIYRLNLSQRRKIQLMALFFVGLLGVLASAVSLVYRTKSIMGANPDRTYNTGILVICNLVEMNVALIVCATPAFASIIRVKYNAAKNVQNRMVEFKRFRNRSSLSCTKKDASLPASFPLEHLDIRKPKPVSRNVTGYVEMSDSWLLDCGVTVDIEASSGH